MKNFFLQDILIEKRKTDISEEQLGEWLIHLKLDRKYWGLLVAFFVTIALDTTMTFAMTMINTGWNEGFIFRFLSAWVIGFVVAFPTSILIIPLIKRFVTRLVE